MKRMLFLMIMLTACGKKDAPSPTQYVTKVELSDYTATAVIDPCGNKPGVINEVLLVLANGQILASFSDNISGQNTRFGLLTPGNYITSDSTLCYFTVDSNNHVINEHY